MLQESVQFILHILRTIQRIYVSTLVRIMENCNTNRQTDIVMYIKIIMSTNVTLHVSHTLGIQRIYVCILVRITENRNTNRHCYVRKDYYVDECDVARQSH